MVKATKTPSKPAKRAARAAGATTPKAPRVVRSQAATAAAAQKAPDTAVYQVLQPFWLNGATVKPMADGAPVWIEMTEAEAKPYQDAGVLGTEPGEVPAIEPGDTSVTTNTQSEGTGATGTESAG